MNGNEVTCCPVCAGSLIFRDRRLRGVKNEFGEKDVYSLRRLRCESCGKIHTELPDFIVPYKRHCAATIERAAHGELDAILMDNPNFEPSTFGKMYTWWQIVSPYFLNVLSGLELKIGEALDKTGFMAIIRAVVNSHNWIFTRSVLTPS